jgi:hypothetical protein
VSKSGVEPAKRPPAAPDGRACNGAAAEDTGRARNLGPPKKVQHCARDQGWSGCPRRRRRPSEPHLGWRRRWPLRSLPSCGPASGNVCTCSRRTVATVGRRFRDRRIRPPLNPAPPCNLAGFSLLFALGRSSSNTLWRHRRRRRPSGPHLATAIGRCGPFLLYLETFPHVHYGRSETGALRPDSGLELTRVVTWIDFPTDFLIAVPSSCGPASGNVSTCSRRFAVSVSCSLSHVWSRAGPTPQAAPIDPEAIKIHRIRPADLKNAPRFPTILRKVKDFVGDSPIVAHAYKNERERAFGSD